MTYVDVLILVKDVIREILRLRVKWEKIV